jgi:hypothetical protein
MAKALVVTVHDLLGEPKPGRPVCPAANSARSSTALPSCCAAKQDKIIEVVNALVAQSATGN